MNIGFVDDEQQVLIGLKYMFQKFFSEHTIVFAEDNALAVMAQLEKHSVDVIFMDVKMPNISGIDLVKSIHKRYPDIFIIVLSAYSDFDFVRMCMKNGAFDYLLKPASYEHIVEIIHRIEPMVTRFQYAKQQQHYASIISMALSGKSAYGDPSTSETLWIIALHSAEPKSDVYTTAHSLFQQNNLSLVFVSGEAGTILSGKTPEADLVSTLRSILQQLQQISGITIYASYLSCPNEKSAIAETFARCVRIAEYHSFNSLSILASYESYTLHRYSNTQVRIHQHINGQMIAKLIRCKDYATLEEMLSQNLNAAKKLTFDPKELRTDLLEEMLILHKNHVSYYKSPPDVQEMRANLLEQILRQPTAASLLMWTYDHVLALVEILADDNFPHYITVSIQYLKNNYMRQISLNEVASHVHLTQWYFSSQFKKYTGQTFSEYLTQIRIEAAKELLLQDDLKIHEVAEMVGFQEPTYFNSVFKRLVGLSPRQFKS